MIKIKYTSIPKALCDNQKKQDDVLLFLIGNISIYLCETMIFIPIQLILNIFVYAILHVLFELLLIVFTMIRILQPFDINQQ